MSAYNKLFEPGIIGKMRIRNRIVSSPMERNYANRDGSVSQLYIDHLVAKARGGVGLIITEATYVDPLGKGRDYELGVYDDCLIPGLRRLGEAVHAHGAKIGLELVYGGRNCISPITSVQPVAPSPVMVDLPGYRELPRELSTDEIQNIIVKFADAARRTKEAGLDMVELHGAHGYLLAQFLSGFANKRTDAYGGSFENRMRFPLEVVDAVRKAVGPDFPVTYRLSGDEYIDGGLTLEETVPFAQKLEVAGIDMIDVSAGLYETGFMIIQPMELPLGCNVPLAEEIRREVNIPVSIAGRINDPVFADTILDEGKADFIFFGRALHADPEFPKKAQEGRLDEICMCMACNQGCIDMLGTQTPIHCAVNATVGRERELQIKPADRKKRVAVIGGGPGGMSAARVAALRGHDVTLYEKSDELGGQLKWACKALYRSEIEQPIRYLSTMMKRAGVNISLNEEMNIEKINTLKPDAVIMATGAVPYIPFIPGLDRDNTITYLDVLSGAVNPEGKKVVVIGGKLIGTQIAEFISEKGGKVILTEPSEALCEDAGFRTKWLLLERVEEDSEITIRLNSTVEKIQGSTVVIQTKGNLEEVDGIDLVVLCFGAISDNHLSDELKWESKIEEIYSIGDCLYPRKMTEAIYEGYVTAMQI